MKHYCVSLWLWGDQVPDNMDPQGGRVYLGLQFEGKVHRGVAGILHPLSKGTMRIVCVQFTYFLGAPSPWKGTTNIRVSLTSGNLDYLPQTWQVQVKKICFHPHTRFPKLTIKMDSST